MPYALKYSKTTMYADDTSLAYSAKSDSDISNAMNCELESLRKWLFSNKLSLNVTKTTMSAKSHGTLPVIYAVDEQQNPLLRKTMLFEGDTNSTGGRNDVFSSS